MRFSRLVYLSIVVLSLILLRTSSPIAAQDTTPTPTPDLRWTIKDITFKSNYPDGFDINLNATSAGGKISNATAYFRTSPKKVFRYPCIVGEDGAVDCQYDAHKRQGFPQWIQVEYWILLTDNAGNVFETQHQAKEYEDTTRKWSRAESDDIIVFWEERLPDNTGNEVIKAMKQQREFYRRNWGAVLPYKPRAILYFDTTPWREWNPEFDVDRLQGETSDDWGGTVQRFAYSVEQLAYGVILHEVDHLYQEWNGGLYTSRIWFYEGDATYFEIVQDYDYLGKVQKMARSGNLPTLQGEGPGYASYRDAYDIGYAFWKWLEATYGKYAHWDVWKRIRDGQSATKALEEVTGKTFVDMETDFRAWLGMKNPVAPTPIELPTLKFPPTRVPKATKTSKP